MKKNKLIQVCLGSFVLVGTLLVSPLAVPLAEAQVDPTLDWTQGIWTAVFGGVNVTGIGTNEVRWGSPAYPYYQKSGLRLIGAGSQTFNVGEQFLLGTFTHFNYPIYNGPSGATLELTLRFSDPLITPDPTFTYNFAIEETPNAWPCPVWQQSGTACDDRITFPVALGEQSFQIGDKLYTLKIVGFVTTYPGGTPVSAFITEEGKSSTAYLVGELSSVLVAIPQITLVAKEVSADGTTWYDADVAPGPNIPVGATVYWRYIVQNTGNVALTSISVTDNQIGTICSGITLNPGDSTTCTATGTALAGQYANIGTVTGYYQTTAYTDSDPSHYYGFNQPPVADANGPYVGNEGSPITFDASGSSDPDGTIVLYEWDLDGDGQYDDATGVNPTFTWGDDYTGTIGLKVTDDGGLTDTDSTTVTVNNVPPIASATNDGPKNEGTPVTVTASQVDPGADTFTYSFDWNNDGIYEIIDQASPSAQYTFMDNGVYPVGVRVRDDDGGIGIATTDVTILDLAPTAEFTWSLEPQNEGSPVQFTDNSTSWPDLIVSWSWNFGDSGTSIEQNPSHAYGDNGIYTVTLTVTDEDGSTDTVSYNVTILNVAPAVEAGPDQTVNEGDTVSFSGNFSDPGWLDTHTYSWDFGDGSPVVTGTLTPTHAYGDNGVYTVTLTVTDDDGGVGIDTMQVIVNNVAPIADAGPDQIVTAGDTVNFTGSMTDPGWLDTHTYEWDFDVSDGIQIEATGQTPTRIYYVAGVYTVTLTVTDDDGGIGTDTLQVTVKPIPATIDCDPDTLNLKSKGDWITCYIELPSGYDVKNIDATTILLNGVVPPELNPKYGFVKSEKSYIMDHDGDGILERMVKFDRAAVQAILSPGPAVTLTLTGKVFYNQGLADFEGQDTIRVIK